MVKTSHGIGQLENNGQEEQSELCVVDHEVAELSADMQSVSSFDSDSDADSS